MRLTLVATLMAIGVSTALYRVSAPTVLPLGARHVSTDLTRAQLVETTLAAHPRNRDNLIAAAMVLDRRSTGIVMYATHDGGRTWIPGRAPRNDSSRKDALDPWVMFTSDGTALFTYLSSGTPNNFAVSRSPDGGRTWSRPTFVPGGLYDREFLVEDASPASTYQGRIYALGKVNVSRLSGPAFQAIAVSDSTDGGQTFSPPHLFVPPNDNDPLWIVAGGVTTRTGKLVVPFATVIRPQATDVTLRYTLWTTESTDGGRVFSAPHLVAPRVVPRGEVQKYISVPSIAIDRSGGVLDGHMYLTWSIAHENGYDIQLWRSQDDGRTWASGVTVNDNPHPAGHVNPAVAVSARGTVAVAWYDRRDDPESNCHRLFLAGSLDGGATFSLNVPATQVRTCLSSRRFSNAGDTVGIAADANGRFHSAFISGSDSAALQVYETPFDVDSAVRGPAALPRAASRPPAEHGGGRGTQ
jgi:hypothetical protein